MRIVFEMAVIVDSLSSNPVRYLREKLPEGAGKTTRLRSVPKGYRQRRNKSPRAKEKIKTWGERRERIFFSIRII
jgi:hypothetical protein